ncbi:MAG: uroporphyrinogen decarboxylase family protein [Planctomycetota bacterium]|jgi:MtaA/CmuA family methyltransferase
MISPRRRVIDALEGKPTDRCPVGPLAVHFTASAAGESLRAYSTQARVLAECVIRYCERFHPDAVWVSADTWITAQAMGAEVCFPEENQPPCGSGAPLIRQPAELDHIPPPDPASQGRMPLMLEALSLVRERLGDEIFIVGCFDQSPFSLACALVGMETMMHTALFDRPFLDALLARCGEYAAAYGESMAEAGADLLSTGDSPAGLIGPDRYREIALPAEQRLFSHLKKACAKPLSLHICGATEPILADMARSGADVLELDHLTDLDAACRIVPSEITIWGNLDPVGLMTRGKPEEIKAAAGEAMDTVRRHGRRRFVLSTGCTLSPQTPFENLEALISAP